MPNPRHGPQPWPLHAPHGLDHGDIVRIALFGGSFDPPHWGHVLASTWARVAGRLDQVWILPVAYHPYAKPLSPWQQRWELCQAAFSLLPFAQVRDDELQNASGFTIDLVEDLRRRQPADEWFLIGGTDTARDLPNWHRGSELARLVTVIAVPRRGFDTQVSALPQISSSEIRRRLEQGLAVGDYLPPAVATLIGQRSWYGPAQAPG